MGVIPGVKPTVLCNRSNPLPIPLPLSAALKNSVVLLFTQKIFNQKKAGEKNSPANFTEYILLLLCSEFETY